jgi:hypothetical protein
VVINKAYSLVRCEEIYTAANSRDGRGARMSANPEEWTTAMVHAVHQPLVSVLVIRSRQVIAAVGGKSGDIVLAHGRVARWVKRDSGVEKPGSLPRAECTRQSTTSFPSFSFQRIKDAQKQGIHPQQDLSHRWEWVAADAQVEPGDMWRDMSEN